jgi:hypothetical protein
MKRATPRFRSVVIRQRILLPLPIAWLSIESNIWVDGHAVIGQHPKRNRRQQREYDKGLYKRRNRLERCFSRLKHLSGFATRHEKKQNQLPGARRPGMCLGYICCYMSILPSTHPDRSPQPPSRYIPLSLPHRLFPEGLNP